LSRRADPWVEGWADLERLVFFSDGVFAIAITLTALQIRVPATPSLTNQSLTNDLRDLLPSIAIYVFSFFVIAVMWTTHNRMYSYIRRGDARLVTLNLAALAVIAFMPFPVTLVGRYGGRPVSVVVYATSMALASVALSAIWLHATWRRRLVDRDLDRSTVRYIGLRIQTVAVLFALSIPLAFLPHGTTIAEYFWVAIFVVRRFLFGFLRRAG
jgi:uncharacterized membrane protein